MCNIKKIKMGHLRLTHQVARTLSWAHGTWILCSEHVAKIKGTRFFMILFVDF